MDRSVDAQIAVVCGGPSAEAEVSRSSAQGVTRALKERYRNVHTLDLTPEVGAQLRELAIDVVFPVLHGPPGEDGTFQGFLEILGLPYVGSDVHASSSAMNKVVAKQLFRSAHLTLADDVVLHRSQPLAAGVDRVLQTLGEYVVVKPANQGSAVGVTRVDNANQLHRALEEALEFDAQVLVEKRIDGREITVGVLDTPSRQEALPVIEIVTPQDSWYDYEHRYTVGLSKHIMPAALPEPTTRALQQAALRAHEVLGCRDLSRADFVVTEAGGIYLLEVNTLPGMTPTSLYPEGAQGIGIDFAELVSILIESALARSARHV